MDLVTLTLLFAYGSLVLELTVFAIPSEASTFQIFFESGRESPIAGSALSRARERTRTGKFLAYLLPTGLGVAMFAIPPVALLYPELLKWLWPIPALQNATALGIGVGLVVLGRLLTFSSVLQLRGQRRAGNLQAAGLFLLSRNPGLVGMYLFYLGNAFLFPCAVLFVGFVPYVVNMHRRVLMEEGHLSERLGDGYRRYLERVPRYLPVVHLR